MLHRNTIKTTELKDSDPVGRGFDSLLARHINQTLTGFNALGSSIKFVFGPLFGPRSSK